MDTTSLNFSLLSFRKRSFVWILLMIMLISFVPVDSLSQQPTAKASEANTIETVQRFLQQLGYNPGPIDGKMGEKTRTAIRAFQRDRNLQVDGEASLALVEALTQATLTQAKRQEQDKERQPTQAELTTMSPNELYVRAVQFEAQGDIENALKYYNYLMETYPTHELAVKAADRVTILSPSRPQPTLTPTPSPQPTATPIPQLAVAGTPTPTPTPVPKSQGMSKGTKIALGVGAVAALGGGIALAVSGGDNDKGCGGVEVGGYCWYYGAEGASCDEACASHGGYHEATRTYAGSDGTRSNCQQVLDALGAPAWYNLVPHTWNFSPLGCAVWYDTPIEAERLWCYGTPTTSSAVDLEVRRACACNK